jgi:hypothetical protein
MFSEKVLFKCGLSKDPNQHNVMTPIQLPCGHSICTTCIPTNKNFIQCQICSQITSQNDLNQIQNESFKIKSLIDNNFNHLIDEIRSQFKFTLSNLKGKQL